MHPKSFAFWGAYSCGNTDIPGTDRDIQIACGTS